MCPPCTARRTGDTSSSGHSAPRSHGWIGTIVRVAVVLSGNAITIEYRDRSPSHHLTVTPGQVDWDEPTDRVHRAVNVGAAPYEEVTVFFLDRPDAVAQPTPE